MNALLRTAVAVASGEVFLDAAKKIVNIESRDGRFTKTSVNLS